ncbi:MAG TPA: hypothetical protein VN578_01245 [Candidatus Binatia bacterium]|jgi:hypothetical protein|nr:hypothetical protein [Candidatus Binatia bacterium]
MKREFAIWRLLTLGLAAFGIAALTQAAKGDYTNLWVELSVANGTPSLVVHSASPDQVFDIFFSPTLAPTNGWWWIARGAPGQTNFTLTTLSPSAGFFTAAPTNGTDANGLTAAYRALVGRPNTLSRDLDQNGLPDAWEILQYGSLGQSPNEVYQGQISNMMQYSLSVLSGGQAQDNNLLVAIDWNNRQLLSSDGTTIALDWSSPGQLAATNLLVRGTNAADYFFGDMRGGSNYNAGNLTGTLPPAAFPSALPQLSAENLTNLNASQLTSGYIPDARLSTNVLLSGAPGNAAGLTNATVSTLFSNGALVTLPSAFGAGSPGSGLHFSASGNMSWDLGAIEVYTNWGGDNSGNASPTMEIHGNSIRLEPGWLGRTFDNPPYLCIGNEDSAAEIFINGLNFSSGFTNKNSVWCGQPLSFRAITVGTNGGLYSCNPGIQGMGFPYNPVDANLDGNAIGELWFYSSSPHVEDSAKNDPNYGTNIYQAYPGILMGKMLTDGWLLKGKQVREQGTAIAGTTTTLSFSGPPVMRLNALSPSIALSTAGWVGPTNACRTTFYIRSGAMAVSAITYPTLWATNGTALPASLGPGQMLRLELEDLGPGESNVVVVSAQVLSDGTFTLDVAAKDYLAAAGVTGDSAVSNAINNFVVALKADGTWNQLSALYPFTASTPEGNAINLINPSTYTITWAGNAVTCGGGVTPGPAPSYGDTHFKPSTGQQDNASYFIYAPDFGWDSGDGAYVMGCYDGAAVYGATRNQQFIPAINAPLAVTGGIGFAAPGAMGICCSRNSSAGESFYFYNGSADLIMNGTASISWPSAPAPQFPAFLFDVNNQGAPGGAQWDKKVQVLAMGAALSQGQYQTLYAATTNLNAALGR